MHPLGMAGLFKIFLAELFLAAAAGTTNIAVCRNVDENCWVIREVVACIVSIGMAVDHKNVFAAAFGANVGIFMGEAHSFLRYIVTDSCAAADPILEKAGKCLKAIPHNSRLTAQAPLRRLRHGICVAKMLDNVGLRYPHRASGAKAPRTLRPLPLLRFAVSATGGAHLCSIQYYLRFWPSICRTSLAVSVLRIMRYCLKSSHRPPA